MIVGAAAIGSTFSVSDSQGNRWNSLTSFNDAANRSQWQLWYAKVTRAGATTVTASSLPAGQDQILAIAEFSGVNSLDVQAQATGSSGAIDSGATPTTSNASELIFGFSGGTGAYSAIAGGSGYTSIDSLQQGTNTTLTFITEYQVVSATGTFDATATASIVKGSLISWMAQVATFDFTTPPPAVGSSSAWLFGF